MSFAKHIIAINEIMENTGNKLAQLDAEIQGKREELQQRKRAATTPARLAAVNEERDEVEAKYRAETAAEIQKARRAADDARKALENDVADFVALNPADVDSATTGLLDRNLATTADLIRFAGQFGKNATMLRVIADQADKLAAGGDSRAQMLSAQLAAFLDPEARMEVFDGAMLNAHIGAGADLFHIARAAWSEHAYGRFKADMEALDTFTFTE